MSLTAEQLKARLGGIGASDAAAAVGLNPYVTPVELWQEKLGIAPTFGGNAATRWGQLLEPAVRQEYAEQTGRVVRLPVGTIHHPDHRFIFCHPDGVTDDGRLYEGKTARFADGWGEPGTDQIPEHYLVQVQHCLCLLKLEVADVAVLIGGQDFRLYEVHADRELQAAIISGEVEFWAHVELKTRPRIDYRSPGALELMRKLYPGTNGQTMQADERIEKLRCAYENARAAQVQGEREADALKAELLDCMGEAAVLKFSDGMALRRSKVSRKGYTVEPKEYVDSRFIKLKG